LSRDQKSRARPKAAKHSGGGVLAGIFMGLLLGALVAAAVAWYFMHAAPVRAPETPPRAAPAAPGMPGAPIALPGKPGDRPVEKPQFDFYKILPQGDNDAPAPPAKPAASAKAGAAPEAAKPAATASADKLYLQMGAFEDPAEADNLKARLALMGIEASSQRVEVPDKGTLHRVRVGPYARVEDMNAVRSQLAQAGIPVAVIRNSKP
jgi:cell division protein FtsN